MNVVVEKSWELIQKYILLPNVHINCRIINMNRTEQYNLLILILLEDLVVHKAEKVKIMGKKSRLIYIAQFWN